MGVAGLGDSMAAAVLRADDLARATTFYTEVLGLTRGMVFSGGAMFMAGKGTAVMIYERPGMAAPESTVLGFAVGADEFDDLMAELRRRGVVFEEYDIPDLGLKTVDGVAVTDGVKGSWFKDTEGNIINVAVM